MSSHTDVMAAMEEIATADAAVTADVAMVRVSADVTVKITKVAATADAINH